jgi:hypothetical protein
VTITPENEARFSVKLSRAIDALRQVANDGDLDLISLNTLALPRASDEAIASFLDPSFTVQWPHGEIRKPPSSVQ